MRTFVKKKIETVIGRRKFTGTKVRRNWEKLLENWHI